MKYLHEVTAAFCPAGFGFETVSAPFRFVAVFV